MEFENKKLRDVAEIARQIMMGEKALHPNQQKLDVHEPEKDELTADDFKKLRAGKKAEVKKEEVEQIEEMEIVKTATGMRVYGSSYGDSAKARRDQTKRPVDDAKGPKMKELKAIEAEKKKKMSEMISTYKEQGLKGLFETLNQNKVIVEEPDSEQFAQEVKTAQDKSEGKGKKAEVAAAGIEAVKQEGVEVVEYPLDANEINGYSEVTIGESVEQIEELSKNTLGSYIKKANDAGGMADFKHGRIADKRGDSKEKTSLAATAHKREKGISTAVDKLSKEEVEPTQLMSFKARYKK